MVVSKQQSKSSFNNRGIIIGNGALNGADSPRDMSNEAHKDRSNSKHSRKAENVNKNRSKTASNTSTINV